VYNPQLFGRTNAGSIEFSKRHVEEVPVPFLVRPDGTAFALADGGSFLVRGGEKERSERGLFDMFQDMMIYVRGEQDEYPDDIVNEATDRLRMTHVPDGTVPQGYVAYGTDLYDGEGNIIWENLLPEPPGDGTPCTPWYGEKFLVFEHSYETGDFLNATLLKALFELMQRIRRRGPTLDLLLQMTEVIGGGYIKDLSLENTGRYYLCYYSLDQDAGFDADDDLFEDLNLSDLEDYDPSAEDIEESALIKC
jgi:hypothetical protein